MAEHTPGEWLLIEGTHSHLVYALNDKGVNQFSAGIQNDNGDCPPDELRDIAHLIASAPRLLEALVLAEDALAVKASLRDPEQARVEKALNNARAAIAAARGEA